MRVPRPLDAAEIRVLGALLEKQQATPEYYPLTLNALVAACNQRSNRDPVMALSEADVLATLERLREHALVWRTSGARVERWEHNLDHRWELDAPSRAVVTVLLLRGAQTPGELRSRTERMHAFESPAEVESVLRRLAGAEEPLVAELPRQPGQKENRWVHLAGERAESPPTSVAPRERGSSEVEERLAALERRVDALAEALDTLRGSIKQG
jgi:uncharacterized protein YceH (UPF0502 family)